MALRRWRKPQFQTYFEYKVYTEKIQSSGWCLKLSWIKLSSKRLECKLSQLYTVRHVNKNKTAVPALHEIGSQIDFYIVSWSLHYHCQATFKLNEIKILANKNDQNITFSFDIVEDSLSSGFASTHRYITYGCTTHTPKSKSYQVSRVSKLIFRNGFFFFLLQSHSPPEASHASAGSRSFPRPRISLRMTYRFHDKNPYFFIFSFEF